MYVAASSCMCMTLMMYCLFHCYVPSSGCIPSYVSSLPPHSVIRLGHRGNVGRKSGKLYLDHE